MSNTIITGGAKCFAHSCLKFVSWSDVHVSIRDPILDLGTYIRLNQQGPARSCQFLDSTAYLQDASFGYAHLTAW